MYRLPTVRIPVPLTIAFYIETNLRRDLNRILCFYIEMVMNVNGFYLKYSDTFNTQSYGHYTV